VGLPERMRSDHYWWGWQMFVGVLDVLFGCTHKRRSCPITSKPGTRRTKAAMATGTYVVCLDCGKEFGYDWNQMKVLSESPAPVRETAESAVGLKAA
jgi:hypothetical protein